jgi:hypothetical protein
MDAKDELTRTCLIMIEMDEVPMNDCRITGHTDVIQEIGSTAENIFAFFEFMEEGST